MIQNENVINNNSFDMSLVYGVDVKFVGSQHKNIFLLCKKCTCELGILVETIPDDLVTPIFELDLNQ